MSASPYTDPERAFLAEQRLGRVATTSAGKVRGAASADTDPEGRHVIRIAPEVVWS
jgi:hypothetical protein